MITVTVCVGSSCHIKGSRELISEFDRLIKEHSLKDAVELKGSFCMERCGKGLNWQINDEAHTSATVDEAVRVFEKQIVRRHSAVGGGEGRGQ